MSGGSYDYSCFRVNDMAQDTRIKFGSPLRRAFGKHLELVSEAMRMVEWVDSSDYSPGDENEAIKRVLQPGAEISALVEMANEVREQLDEAISRLEHK